MQGSNSAESGVVRSALNEAATSLREIFSQRSLRRVQYALIGSELGDQAFNVAVTVWAYGAGGVKAIGIWNAVRLILMALSTPLAASLADRFPRKPVMISADLARAALVTGAAACVASGTPSAPVYVLATMTVMLGSVFRPAQAAWLPELAERPEQLTAANGVSSTVESLAFFIGPGLGALLIAATNVQTVFLVDAASFVWSAGIVASIVAGHTTTPDDESEDDDEEGVLAELLAGFREIGRDRGLRLVTSLVGGQAVVAGICEVVIVVFAVNILHTGARGVGYINAIFGVGAVVGGAFAIARALRKKLAVDLTVGVLLWSLPLLLIAAWPSGASVFTAAVLIGIANPLVEVNFCTAIQRMAPERIIGRVFGAIEGSMIAGMAIGACIAPFLVDALGLRPTLAIVALAVGVPTVAVLPAARALDTRLEPPEDLALLQSLPIFAPLGPARLDVLARHLVPIEVAAGSVVITAGEVGDMFYLIKSGRVSVTHEGQFVREEGPGEYFGEIALLRGVPRTATVTAIEDTALLGLSRAHFLNAVQRTAESSGAVEAVVSYRMRF
jgi:MFS family permease